MSIEIEQKIETNYDIEIQVFKDNVEELPDGNLRVFLFGSLVLVHNGNSLESYNLTLGSKVIVPIYTPSQITKDEDHIRLSFDKDDVVVDDRYIEATLDNFYQLFNFLLMGKMSNLIPYYKYLEIIENCMRTNVSIKIPRLAFEILISEIFVDNSGRPARLTGSKGNAIGIQDKVLLSNTFNSMTFEDPTKAILINKGKTFEEQDRNRPTIEKFFRK